MNKNIDLFLHMALSFQKQLLLGADFAPDPYIHGPSTNQEE